mmetsp:Transcript_275/g.446  ORF Transcript_275/g.446 Transcript_275/m.446 type:complete len:282 (-) Transcript_275:62-907(-)
MLAADKLQLQSALKQQATALKEKEFNLHHSNLMTVGTQAAVLAGLDITMFIEFQPPANSEWGELEMFARCIKFCYYITIVAAFCANMLVVSHTTSLSVLGAGMALRGPDGSMMTATDGLYDERNSVFYVFGVGLACTVGSVVLCVWLILSWESALVCMGVTIMTCRRIYRNYVRVVDRFDYDENETVDFTDIFEGPAAIRAVSVPYREVLRRKKKGDSGELRIDTRRIDTRQVQRQNPNSLPSSDSDDEVQGLHCVRATRRRQPVARNSPSASGSIDLQTV